MHSDRYLKSGVSKRIAHVIMHIRNYDNLEKLGTGNLKSSAFYISIPFSLDMCVYEGFSTKDPNSKNISLPF